MLWRHNLLSSIQCTGFIKKKYHQQISSGALVLVLDFSRHFLLAAPDLYFFLFSDMLPTTMITHTTYCSETVNTLKLTHSLHGQQAERWHICYLHNKLRNYKNKQIYSLTTVENNCGFDDARASHLSTYPYRPNDACTNPQSRFNVAKHSTMMRLAIRQRREMMLSGQRLKPCLAYLLTAICFGEILFSVISSSRSNPLFLYVLEGKN